MPAYPDLMQVEIIIITNIITNIIINIITTTNIIIIIIIIKVFVVAVHSLMWFSKHTEPLVEMR